MSGRFWVQVSVVVTDLICGFPLSLPRPGKIGQLYWLENFFTELFNTAPAAVDMAWPLLGSHRSGQAVLYLFQTHFLFWKYGSFRNEPKTLGGVCAALPLLPVCLLSPLTADGKSPDHSYESDTIEATTVTSHMTCNSITTEFVTLHQLSIEQWNMQIISKQAT